jgi:hypothetical protein
MSFHEHLFPDYASSPCLRTRFGLRELLLVDGGLGNIFLTNQHAAWRKPRKPAQITLCTLTQILHLSAELREMNDPVLFAAPCMSREADICISLGGCFGNTPHHGVSSLGASACKQVRAASSLVCSEEQSFLLGYAGNFILEQNITPQSCFIRKIFFICAWGLQSSAELGWCSFFSCQECFRVHASVGTWREGRYLHTLSALSRASRSNLAEFA